MISYDKFFVSEGREIERIDLKDATFVIPIYIDSPDRLRNVVVSTAYILANFETNVLIKEVGKKPIFQNEALPVLEDILEFTVEINYEFEESRQELFHRQRIINEMVIGSKTKVIVNQDCDVILPVSSYCAAYQCIIDDTYDIVYPFGKGMSCRSVQADDKIAADFLRTLDFDYLNRYSEFQMADFGFIQLLSREVYIEGGLENENFVSYAPEDKERFHRFTKLGYRVGRISDYLYHLEHMRGINSCQDNPAMLDNIKLWNKIKKMDKGQLKEYYRNQEYLKKYC